MRIAILSPIYPYRGGIAQFSAMLYQELVKEGHEVEAFNFKRLYPDFLFPGKTQYVEEGDNAVKVESLRILDSINPFTYSKTVKALRDFKPDVLVIAYWMSFFVPGYAHIANRMKKHCKVITLIHNAIPHEPRFFDKPMASLFFRQSDGFIVMSDTVKDDLLQLCPGARFLLKPHPLYDQFGDKIEPEIARKELELDPEKKTILFFGLIRDYKGLDLLIDAFGRLDDTYQMIIAGESYGSFDKYEEQISRTKHPDQIKVLNRYISDADVPLLFSAADVCVLPYRSATQSGIISVAYHFETPLIATRVGGLNESIEKQGVGLMVPEINAMSIAETIRHFFSIDPAVFAENFNREKEKLSWQSFCQSLLSFSSTLPK